MSKPRLYRQIYESSELASLSYILELTFAAGIATFGLVLNSPAVVIGAMLISPLMGPILAAGLAFAASDIYLGVKSFLTLAGSIVAAMLFSAGLVWALPFQSPTSEILARTQPNLLDLGIAIFSGLAGSFVLARSLSGGAASALPGVAIAVALMPPLCAVGFGIGSGWNWPIISGAALLFLTNLVAIAGSAFLVFYLVGMGAPEVRASITEDARRHAAGSGIYTLLHNTSIARLFGDVGQLRWRILMVAVTIGALFVPLRTSLMQLRYETISRAAAREAVRAIVPSDHLLSQELEILPDRLIQRVVTTNAIDRPKVLAAEEKLSRHVGKAVSIQIRQVANEEELITLRERLRTNSQPPPPAPPTIQSMAQSVLPNVEEAIQSVWPKESADFVGYELGLNRESVVLRLTYQSRRAMDAAAQETLRNALRRALNIPALATVIQWQPAPKTVAALRVAGKTPRAQ